MRKIDEADVVNKGIRDYEAGRIVDGKASLDKMVARYKAEKGYRAMVQIQEEAEKNSVSNMTLDEINAEIEASRKERRLET